MKLYFIILIFISTNTFARQTDSIVVSRDSLIKVVNEVHNEGSAYIGNESLKIYFKNKKVIDFKNQDKLCIEDSMLDLTHLTSLPIIVSVDRLDSNRYILLGYNLNDKKTGKFIWIINVSKNNLVITKQIAMLSKRSPDEIDFYFSKKEDSFYILNTSNKMIGGYIYSIGKTCKDTFRINPYESKGYLIHYQYPGLFSKNRNLNYENTVMTIYKIELK